MSDRSAIQWTAVQPPSSCLPRGPRPDRPHWQPCPGECGRYMPQGQRCFDCAAAMTREWAKRRRRVHTESDPESSDQLQMEGTAGMDVTLDEIGDIR